MKKLLLSFCAILFATATFAQHQKQLPNFLNERIAEKITNNSAVIPTVTASNSVTAPSPIFSDDFSDPSTWVVDHDPLSCALDWQVGQNLSCQGSYQINTIVSTTAANGYALIDSDYYGGATGGTEIEDCWLTMANPVDLNGYPNVVVEFEAQYRSYNAEQTYIVVGIGDGSGNVIWPDLTPTTDITSMTNVFKPFEYTSGDQTTNPELVTVDISSALVGLTSTELADIYIRFHWTGTWGYAWFVDDFAISETPPNGVSSKLEVIGGYWVDYANYTGAGLNDLYGLDYSLTPLSQLANHPFVFESLVKNTGVATQDIRLHYDITGPATASGMSSPVTLNSQEEEALSAAPPFGDANTPTGYYDVDIYAMADSVGAGITITTSDIITRTFGVTDYVYAKDLGAAENAYILGGAGDQNHITTRFEMYANEQLYSARVYIDDNSTVGAEVKAVLYELDTTATDGLFFLDESDNHIIQTSDLGAWIDIPFVNPIALYSGYAYEFGVAGFYHPTDTSYVGVSGGMMYAGEHSSYDELGLSTQSAGTPTWYYISKTPMVRMNFDPASITTVSDLEKSIFSVFPNPTSGDFVVQLDKAKEYDLAVYNVLGQTVLSKSINAMSTKINLSMFDKGIYTVELKDGDAIYNEKVLVE